MPAENLVAERDLAVDFCSAIEAWQGKATIDGVEFDAAGLGRSFREIRRDLFEIGIDPGDLVFVAGGQHLDTLVTVAAAIDLGATAVLADPLASSAMLEELVASARPLGIVIARERAKAASGVFSGPARALAGGRLTFLAAPEPARLSAPVGCLGLVSSGTSGTPKIVVHRPQNALRNGRLHAASIGLGRGDCFLMTLPMHFSFGFVACVLGCICSGADIVVSPPAMTPAVFAAMVEKTGATVYSATPAMLRRVLSDLPLPESLRVLSIGGDVMPPHEVERVRRQFGGRMFLTYGLTEAGPRVFTREVMHGETAPFDLGEALPGVTSRLGPLPPDRAFDPPAGYEAGELHVLTSTAMLGLWERGGLSRVDFEGEWLRTGDAVLKAPDGRLFFHDRLKSIVVSGGEKISFGLIRRVLLEHQSVVAVRIWAGTDLTLGQIPLAAVQLRDDCVGREDDVLKDIQAWNAKRLRRPERPRSIVLDTTLSNSLK